jgi:hypothetical protein
MREPEGGGAEAVAVEERLRYQREVLINFRNSTYQWISLKLFTLPADVDDYTVLQLLIGHVRYRDGYGGTKDRDMEIIHGPYWLHAISPEAFHLLLLPMRRHCCARGPSTRHRCRRAAARKWSYSCIRGFGTRPAATSCRTFAISPNMTGAGPKQRDALPALVNHQLSQPLRNPIVRQYGHIFDILTIGEQFHGFGCCERQPARNSRLWPHLAPPNL